MGTKVAPTYATLVMGYLEQRFYQKVEGEFDLEFRQYIEQNWKRFLDDCFIFWIKSLEEMRTFHEILNSIHPSIEFTTEFSETELPFRDVNIRKSGQKIETDVFYKKTDTHQYLNFYSCHPTHTKRNIPFNMARRICTIVSDPERKEIRLKELVKFLRNQHYPQTLINAGISKAKEIPRQDLHTNNKGKEDKCNVALVATHNPRHTNVFQVAKSNFQILKQSTVMDKLITEKQIINSRRQPANLKKLLTCAKFTSNIVHKVRKCNDTRCGTCSYLSTGRTFYFKTGQSFTVKTDMTVRESDILYHMRGMPRELHWTNRE